MWNIILTVDRIEGNYAVLIDENEQSLIVPLTYFASEPRESEVYDLTFTPRPDLQKEKQVRIAALFNKLKNKGE